MGRAKRGFGNSAQNGLCQHCFFTKIAVIDEGLIRNASSCFQSSPTRVRSSSLGSSGAAIVAAKYCRLDRSIFSFCSLTALDVTGINPSISWPGTEQADCPHKQFPAESDSQLSVWKHSLYPQFHTPNSNYQWACLAGSQHENFSEGHKTTWTRPSLSAFHGHLISTQN